MGRPSMTPVAEKFRQAGQSVSAKTLRKWRRNGWRRIRNLRPTSPLETARVLLDAAVPVLTGDARTRIKDFMTAEDAKLMIVELGDMNDVGRVKMQARAMSEAIIRVATEFEKQ